MIRAIVISILLWSSPAVADPVRLFELVDQRLELMQTVAAWKWQHHVAIEDLEREALVLEQATTAARMQGLEPESTRRFFEAQVEAAKEIQSFWFDRYVTERTGGQAPDLEITREQLTTLGDDIVRALAEAAPIGPDWQSAFNASVQVAGLTKRAQADLFSSLTQVRPLDSALDRVLARGVLRVGTTGDYAPFSFSGDGQTFAGIDIDLARNLAAALGVKVAFIQTSWPTLMDDLVAGRYDIAMSGVSRTLERARLAYFSPAYHTGGKTPVVRCRDRRQYRTLEDIDRAGVRVIVNPGGTNFRFVEENIRDAEVIIFNDNRLIFDEIAADRADVMITDEIEVRLVSGKQQELCAAMPGKTLTFQQKAFMMPRDEPLRSFVTLWLEQRIGDGTVEATFERYLGQAR